MTFLAQNAILSGRSKLLQAIIAFYHYSFLQSISRIIDAKKKLYIRESGYLYIFIYRKYIIVTNKREV